MGIKIYHVYRHGYEGKHSNKYAFTKRRARKQFDRIRDSLIRENAEIVEMDSEELKEFEQKKDLAGVEFTIEEKNSYQKEVDLLSQMTFDNCHDKKRYVKIFGDSVSWEKIKVGIL